MINDGKNEIALQSEKFIEIALIDVDWAVEQEVGSIN